MAIIIGVGDFQQQVLNVKYNTALDPNTPSVIIGFTVGQLTGKSISEILNMLGMSPSVAIDALLTQSGVVPTDPNEPVSNNKFPYTFSFTLS